MVKEYISSRDFWFGLISSSLVALIACYSIDVTEEWIGFWGSVIGGIITLIALVTTLKHNEKMVSLQIKEARDAQEKQRIGKEIERIPNDMQILNEISNSLSEQANKIIGYIVPEFFVSELTPVVDQQLPKTMLLDGAYEVLNNLRHEILETQHEFLLQAYLLDKQTLDEEELAESFDLIFSNAQDEMMGCFVQAATKIDELVQKLNQDLQELKKIK